MSHVPIYSRYQLSGTEMPSLKQWIQDTVGVNLDFKTPSQPEITAKDIPVPVHNESFLSDVRKHRLPHSDDPQDRLFRAHGMSRLCLSTRSSTVVFPPSMSRVP